MSKPITGKDLIDWGFSPGKWFSTVLPEANSMRAGGASDTAIAGMVCTRLLEDEACRHEMGDACPVHVNIHADTPEDEANIAAVMRHARELARVPTVKGVSIMPDACPAGDALGTIPVGGVAMADNAIHPAMHSADICCSVAITVIGDVDPSAVLDAVHSVTHFGPGGRSDHTMPDGVRSAFRDNPLLDDVGEDGDWHFATQGDGNHFAFVGRLRSNGETALITHHGSRKPGARLYKKGKALAEKHRREIAPSIARVHAWIPADSRDGEDYWNALQVIRAWTKASHFAIHDLTLRSLGRNGVERYWNEHNFVFRRGGMFYHGKGATPAWPGFAVDATALRLIPLNMAEPVLIVRGNDTAQGLGFCPHGAGRNLSRTAFRRGIDVPDERFLAEQTVGLDTRFFCGIPDISELPGAYKNASAVRSQIEHYGLAEVVDTVEPFGCIMAGDWEQNAPWRRGK